jgi:P4 family phage/plasmid primase-like protien
MSDFNICALPEYQAWCDEPAKSPEPELPEPGTDEEQVYLALQWVHPSPGIIELRPTNKGGKCESGFYSDRRQLVRDAADFGGRAMYWTINQIDGALADKVTNEITPAKKGGCTQNKHIARITNIVFDCDAVRPTGWPATDAEHAATLEVAQKIKRHLTSLGFPEPAVFDSGNGTYLIYKTDLSPELKPLVRAFIEHISKLFSTKDDPTPGAKVWVDDSVWKLPQILRVPGTWNRKKQPTPERPHRRAWIISIPEKRELVTAAMLSSIVPVADEEEKPEGPMDEITNRANEILQRHMACLEARKVRFAPEQGPDESTILRLDKCPFKSKVQEDGRAWLRVSKWGNVTAGCFHAHCQGKTLKHLYQILRWEEWLESEDLQESSLSERVTNPHRLAAAHLKRHAINGDRTYVHLGEQLYKWRNGLYTPVSDKAVTPAITATVKAEFDEHARSLKKRGGSGITQAVKRSHVGDTLNALKSLGRLPSDKTPPCWLAKREWGAEDCIPFENGILHIPSFLEGKNCWIGPTPAFFNRHILAFAYDPKAPEPSRWRQFLRELWDDTACHDLLHEWGGYCMTRDTSLQKYLTLLGVPRAGKGTICWMLGQMVGGNYGSPTYRSILGKNGLEPLRGRQLAIFPDAKGVPKNVLSEFCGTLKAIVGEDALPIDAKYERVVTEQLKLKVILQLNEVLAIPDNSAALEARQLFLHFTKSFVGREDHGLKATLSKEFSGVATLFLDGLHRLHRNKGVFTEPQSSRELARIVRREAVPLRTFVEEACVLDPGCAVLTAEIYAAYTAWAEDNDQKPLEKSQFGTELFQVCQTLTRSQNAGRYTVAPVKWLEDYERPARPYYYLGIRLK